METMEMVLDHGFIELIDMMGNDLEPAQAARISYGAKARGWDEGDGKLTRYLLENGHTSPFEMVEIKWRVKLPIFVARQWIRHRTANVNEFSMRYADPSKLSQEDEVEFYIPEEWRAQDTVNKQGSIDWRESAETWGITHQYEYAVGIAVSTYERMIQAGVAKEMARMILPVSAYTEWIWKNDLHNTLHFLNLRLDEHAQWEIRQYAEAMERLLKAQLPHLMGLWEEVRSA